MPWARGPSHALFAISVTAEITGLHPQTLRDYESKGLVRPSRTAGGTRRYSDADIERIGRIVQLLSAGVNLAGIGRILTLETENADLRREIAGLRAELARHPGAR